MSNGSEISPLHPSNPHGSFSGEFREVANNDSLTPVQDDILRRFLDRELKLFESVPGRTNVVKHEIVLEVDTPIKQRYYPVSPAIQREINRQVDEMLASGVIEPSHSSWSNPVLLVPKQDGSRRFVVDFRKVNSVSKVDAYPIPYMSSILDKLRAGKYVTTLDLEKGYWQVELHPSSKEITAFTVPGRGLFHFNVMPFGLHSAGATFQRLMDRVLGPELEPHCFAYLDDIVVVSQSFEEHLEHVREVFRRLRNAGLRINTEKCHFVKFQLKFLGYIVGGGKLRVDPDKVSAVRNYPNPINKTELKRFLGFVSWYRRFVPNFATVAAPLTDLLKKKNPAFVWDKEQGEAFRKLKEFLISAPILSCPHFDYPFTIQCDASEVGIGGVLSQEINGVEHVVAYCSRTLSSAERNYSVTEKECLAVLFSINKFRPYIEGYRFTVITDHASLRWLFNCQSPQGRLARWISQIQQYTFEVIHRKGKFHVVPDALSRIGALKGVGSFDPTQIKDPWYIKLREKVERNPELHPRFQMIEGRLYTKGSTRKEPEDWKLVVPVEKREEMLHLHHSSHRGGHLGFYKTWRNVQNFYFWPGLRRDVGRYVQECRKCQRYKAERAKPAGTMEPRRMVKPWTVVSSDIIGPFPRSLRGSKYVLMFVDTCTRWPIAIPLRSVKCQHVAQYFRTHVINEWGCPEVVITDNGPQYVGQILRRVCKLYGVRLHHTAPYHPQANMCERTNQTLKTMIAIFCEGAQRKWDENLSDLMFALRSAVSETTGFSPAMLNFGRELRKPEDLYRELDMGEIREFEPCRYAEGLKKSLVDIHRRAEAAQEKASIRQAHYYNLRRRREELTKGTLVWRKSFPHSSAVDFKTAKLEPKYIGPFRVADTRSHDVYDLVSLNGKPAGRWHIKDLKVVS
jgi:transposase InsO family protein